MDAQSFIQTVLPYLYGLLALAGVFALIQLGRLFAATQKQVKEIGDKAQPIVEKADVSVDALNAELLRVDGILGDVERITNAAANTTQSIEQVTSAPLEIATTLSDKLRDLVSGIIGKAKEDTASASTANKTAHPQASSFDETSPGSSSRDSYVTSTGGAQPAVSSRPQVIPDEEKLSVPVISTPGKTGLDSDGR